MSDNEQDIFELRKTIERLTTAHAAKVRALEKELTGRRKALLYTETSKHDVSMVALQRLRELIEADKNIESLRKRAELDREHRDVAMTNVGILTAENNALRAELAAEVARADELVLWAEDVRNTYEDIDDATHFMAAIAEIKQARAAAPKSAFGKK